MKGSSTGRSDAGRGDIDSGSGLPPVTVVVPARNAASTLGDQLAALALQTYTGWWEVVVVDNDSEDGTAAVARSYSDPLARLRVLDARGRIGANHARNVGVRAAKGVLIAFCDADDIVSPRWLECLVAAAEADLVGGSVDVRGLAPPGELYVRRPWGLEEAGLGFLPFVSTSSCAVWKDVLLEAGGMNEAYLACQDVELSWRLQLLGKRITFTEAVVQHRPRDGIGPAFRQHLRRGIAHVQLFRDFRSHGMPRRAARGLAAWIWLLVTGPLALVWSRFRGLWIRRAGVRLGQAVGSLRFRAFYP